MIRVIPKECTGLLGSAVSVAWAGWVIFILQGNDSVSGRFRRLDVSGLRVKTLLYWLT